MIPRPLLALVLLLVPAAHAAVPSVCDSDGTDTVRATTPTERFHRPQSYAVVVDKETGLMWARCPLGYTFQSGTCEPSANSADYLFTWKQALDAVLAVNDPANPFLGTGLADGWRLPNIKELASIVERQCADPALNGVIFPGHPPAYYWSGTPVAQVGAAGSTDSPTTTWEGRVWVVNMGSGAVLPIVKGDPDDPTTERGLALPVRELTDAEFQDWLSR